MSSHISPLRRCCINVIESGNAGLDLVIAAARAIEADAEFNMYFHALKASRSLSNDALIEILEQNENMSASVEAAYAAFESDPNQGAPPLSRALDEYRDFARRQMSSR